MAKAKDKRLMMDMLRHPATVFYRDDDLLVLKVPTLQSYQHYTDGDIKFPRPGHLIDEDSLSEIHIVRTFRDDLFIVQIESWENRRAYFRFYDKAGALTDNFILERVQRNPSLFKAFGTIAKQYGYLPLIENQSDEDIERALRDDTHNIKYIRNLTHKRKLKILEKYPNALKSVDQTHEVVMHALNIHGGRILRDVGLSLRTEKICRKAVATYAHAIEDVPSSLQTEALQLEAVRRDGSALGLIKNPSIAVCIAAVNKSPDAWKAIKDPKLRKKIEQQRHLRRYR